MEDVLIIGGGVGGLNAALILSRVRRRVLVVDSGRPRNAPAQQVHGFVSLDGTPPAEHWPRVGRRSSGTADGSSRARCARYGDTATAWGPASRSN